MPDFLADPDDVPPAGQGGTEKGGECLGDLLHILLPVILRQPDNVVQRIVQKVRVDLGLQKLKLHVPEMDLLLPVVFHQLTDPRSHAVEPVRQCADLRTARDLGPGIQVSGADLVRSLDQSRNRVGDAAGDEGGDP